MNGAFWSWRMIEMLYRARSDYNLVQFRVNDQKHWKPSVQERFREPFHPVGWRSALLLVKNLEDGCRALGTNCWQAARAPASYRADEALPVWLTRYSANSSSRLRTQAGVSLGLQQIWNSGFSLFCKHSVRTSFVMPQPPRRRSNSTLWKWEQQLPKVYFELSCIFKDDREFSNCLSALTFGFDQFAVYSLLYFEWSRC